MSYILQSIASKTITFIIMVGALFIPINKQSNSGPSATSTQKNQMGSILNTKRILTATTTLGTPASTTNLKKTKNQTINPPKNPPSGNKMEVLAPKSTILSETKVTSTSIPMSAPKIGESWDNVNVKVRQALVNIICTTVPGGLFNPISGSGVIIDPRGVILTNAHIAQLFLLKDYRQPDYIDCTIRQNSPAKPLYKAKIMYISPSWVLAHYKDILLENPFGTGEYDFSFLFITNPVSSSTVLPNNFPFVPLETSIGAETLGEPVLLVAYPAGFLGGPSVQTGLYISSAQTNIKNLYTFDDNIIDVISLGGSIIAQKGSSGGAVVNSEGKLIGIVVTSTEATSTSERDLRAITLPYINNALKKESNIDINTLLSGSLSQTADSFNENISPILTSLLTNVLDKTAK